MEAVCGGALSDIGDARDCETWNLETGSLMGGGGEKERENGKERGTNTSKIWDIPDP